MSSRLPLGPSKQEWLVLLCASISTASAASVLDSNSLGVSLRPAPTSSTTLAAGPASLASLIPTVPSTPGSQLDSLLPTVPSSASASDDASKTQERGTSSSGSALESLSGVASITQPMTVQPSILTTTVSGSPSLVTVLATNEGSNSPSTSIVETSLYTTNINGIPTVIPFLPSTSQTSEPELMLVATTINNVPSLIPLLIDGDITSTLTLPTPQITLEPTGTEISSSRQALQTHFASIIPLINNWIEDTTKDIEPDLEDTEHFAEQFMSNLEPGSGGGGGGGNKGGCTKSLLSFMGCAVSTVTKIRSSVTGVLSDAVIKTITTELGKLKNLADEFPKVPDVAQDGGSGTNPKEPDGDASASQSASKASSVESSESSKTSSTSSTTSSTSGCTQTVTATNEAVRCWTTPATDGGSSLGTTCTTSTVVNTGCSISASSTTTTESFSSPSIRQCTRATGQSVAKKQRSIVDEDDQAELEKRVFPNIAGDWTTWQNQQVSKSYTRNVKLSGDYGAEVPGDIDSTSDFYEFKGDVMNVVLGSLEGCTAVVVVSTRGVYVAHIYEAPSMSDKFGPPEWDDDQHEYVQEVEILCSFDQDVGRELPQGGSALRPGTDEKVMWGLNDVNGPGQILSPHMNVLQAFIVTPRSGQPDDDENVPLPSDANIGDTLYPDKVARIVDIVHVAIGVSPRIIGYTKRIDPIEEGPPIAYDKILLQYDPFSRWYESTAEVDGQQQQCTKQVAAYRLFVMENPTPYTNDWDAWADQAAQWPTVFARKRQAPACVVLPSSDLSSGSGSPPATALPPASVSVSAQPIISGTPADAATAETTAASMPSSLPPITSCTTSMFSAVVFSAPPILFPFSTGVAITKQPKSCVCNDGQTERLQISTGTMGTTTWYCSGTAELVMSTQEPTLFATSCGVVSSPTAGIGGQSDSIVCACQSSVYESVSSTVSQSATTYFCGEGPVGYPAAQTMVPVSTSSLQATQSDEVTTLSTRPADIGAGLPSQTGDLGPVITLDEVTASASASASPESNGCPEYSGYNSVGTICARNAESRSWWRWVMRR